MHCVKYKISKMYSDEKFPKQNYIFINYFTGFGTL